MNLPEWLPPLLQQFPIVGIIVGIVWFLLRLANRTRREDAQEAQRKWDDAMRRVDAEIARTLEEKEQLKQKHEAEIKRLERRHEREIARLKRGSTNSKPRPNNGDDR